MQILYFFLHNDISLLHFMLWYFDQANLKFQKMLWEIEKANKKNQKKSGICRANLPDIP